MLIDVHCHLNLYLQHKKFGNDIGRILKTIENNAIVTITNSMDLTSYNCNKHISNQCKYVYTAFGIHPWNAHKYIDKKDLLLEKIQESPIIGEIGLDFYFVKERYKYALQKEIFDFFLQHSRDKILSIHTKGAEREVLELLKKNKNSKVMIHWFSGKLNILKKMIRNDFYFSITPEIRNSDHIKKIVELVPLDRLLSETDNPGGPMSYTHQIGTPLLLRDVIQEIAKIKKRSPEEVEYIISENFTRLSGDSLDLSEHYV